MKINLEKTQIRKFGIALTILLLVIGSWKFYKGKMTPSYIFLTMGALSFASAMFFQPIIKPVYIAMMKAAHVLGWVNTRILLTFIYYFIMTPIGLLMRISGKDILDENIEPRKEDYWVRREKIAFDSQRYEKQY